MFRLLKYGISLQWLRICCQEIHWRTALSSPKTPGLFYPSALAHTFRPYLHAAPTGGMHQNRHSEVTTMSPSHTAALDWNRTGFAGTTSSPTFWDRLLGQQDSTLEGKRVLFLAKQQNKEQWPCPSNLGDLMVIYYLVLSPYKPPCAIKSPSPSIPEPKLDEFPKSLKICVLET